MLRNEELLEKAADYRNVVIFGYNDIGKYLYHMIVDQQVHDRVCFCDNSHKKQGIDGGYEVYSVQKAADEWKDALYLIMGAVSYDVMARQLIDYGVDKHNIVKGITQELWEWQEKNKRRQKETPLQELQFEVDIVSHCNLNCKCCSQFSCIAEEEYIDLNVMERDFNRLGELFGGKVKRIYLIGGEPLLHPNMIQCMKIARKYFSQGEISVFSNGLLLLQQSEEFWRSCRDNQISIIITKYPIALKHEEILQKAADENVQLTYFGNSEDFKYMHTLGLDLNGKQNMEESFAECGEANNCIKLQEGKLFTCTRPAAIYKFNRFFEKNLEVTQDDYVDIYKVRSAEEILKFLAQPIPFCRYCNMSASHRKAMDWGRTEKKIDEWC